MRGGRYAPCNLPPEDELAPSFAKFRQRPLRQAAGGEQLPGESGSARVKAEGALNRRAGRRAADNVRRVATWRWGSAHEREGVD